MIEFEHIRLGAEPPSCVRCGASQAAPARSAEDVSAEIAGVCASWTEATGPNLALVGGESCSAADLAGHVAAAVAAGARRVRVDATLASIEDESAADSLVGAGLTGVRMQLLGSPQAHDSLAGARGGYARTRRGVELLRGATSGRSEFDVSARVAVCSHNAQDIPSAVAAAGEAGASSIVLQVVDAGLALTAVAPWMLAACDTGTVNSVWVELVGIPYCAAPGHALHVASTVRPVAGAKGDSCASCALDAWCAGACEDADADVVGELAAPPGDDVLAEAVSRARTAIL
jgi:hypothetical protein